MIAQTTMSSMSVNPRSPERLRDLPIRILRPVQSGRLALRMYVEDVHPVGRQGIGAVFVGAGPPIGLAGDRVARQTPEILHFRAGRVADVVPLIEPVELFRVTVFVGGVDLRPAHPGVVLDVPLETVDRRADLAEGLPELELLSPL